MLNARHFLECHSMCEKDQVLRNWREWQHPKIFSDCRNIYKFFVANNTRAKGCEFDSDRGQIFFLHKNGIYIKCCLILERYYTWVEYLKGKKFPWVSLNVSKRSIFKKLKRITAPEMFLWVHGNESGFESDRCRASLYLRNCI